MSRVDPHLRHRVLWWQWIPIERALVQEIWMSPTDGGGFGIRKGCSLFGLSVGKRTGVKLTGVRLREGLSTCREGLSTCRGAGPSEKRLVFVSDSHASDSMSSGTCTCMSIPSRSIFHPCSWCGCC